MRIVVAWPPNFAVIRSVIPEAEAKGVLFCWGSTIFNPWGEVVPPALIAHELVHSERQDGDPDAWWDKYLADVTFRLAEEVPAHVAEYQWWVHSGANRQQRRRVLAGIAKRLSGPLYGRMVSPGDARKVLANG